MAKRDTENETSVRLLDKIVSDFVRQATMTEIPSKDPRIRSFILDRPHLHLIADEPGD